MLRLRVHPGNASLLTVAAALLLCANGGEDPSVRAKRLWLRLTHTYGGSADEAAKLATMTSLVAAGKLEEAAAEATRTDPWVNNEVRLFAAPWASPTGSTAVTFGETQALTMLIAKRGLDGDAKYGDFRNVLGGTFGARIRESAKVGNNNIPERHYMDPNSHYTYIETFGLSAAQVLEPVEPQVAPYKVQQRDGANVRVPYSSPMAPAGILTTPQVAQINWQGGTHRRVLHYLAKHFLGRGSIDGLFDASVDDVDVGCDVARDNWVQFQTNCRGCHSQMDSMRTAFAFYNFEGGIPQWRENLAPQFERNIFVFPDGKDITKLPATEQDLWVNRSTSGHNADLGWRGPTAGRGATEFGRMIANSEAFSRTMARRVFRAVCHRSPEPSEEARLRELAVSHFEAQNYFLHRLYEGVAAMPGCIP